MPDAPSNTSPAAPPVTSSGDTSPQVAPLSREVLEALYAVRSTLQAPCQRKALTALESLLCRADVLHDVYLHARSILGCLKDGNQVRALWPALLDTTPPNERQAAEKLLSLLRMVRAEIVETAIWACNNGHERHDSAACEVCQRSTRLTRWAPERGPVGEMVVNLVLTAEGRAYLDAHTTAVQLVNEEKGRPVSLGARYITVLRVAHLQAESLLDELRIKESAEVPLSQGPRRAAAAMLLALGLIVDVDLGRMAITAAGRDYLRNSAYANVGENLVLSSMADYADLDTPNIRVQNLVRHWDDAAVRARELLFLRYQTEGNIYVKRVGGAPSWLAFELLRTLGLVQAGDIEGGVEGERVEVVRTEAGLFLAGEPAREPKTPSLYVTHYAAEPAKETACGIGLGLCAPKTLVWTSTLFDQLGNLQINCIGCKQMLGQARNLGSHAAHPLGETKTLRVYLSGSSMATAQQEGFALHFVASAQDVKDMGFMRGTVLCTRVWAEPAAPGEARQEAPVAIQLATPGARTPVRP